MLSLQTVYCLSGVFFSYQDFTYSNFLRWQVGVNVNIATKEKAALYSLRSESTSPDADLAKYINASNCDCDQFDADVQPHIYSHHKNCNYSPADCIPATLAPAVRVYACTLENQETITRHHHAKMNDDFLKMLTGQLTVFIFCVDSTQNSITWFLLLNLDTLLIFLPLVPPV